MIEHRVNTLLAHTGLAKHTRGYSAQEISALIDRGESVYLTPLTITQDGYVVDGYAVWQLAKYQHRTTVPCIMLHISEEEAFLHLIDKNRGSKGINDFSRILLALELEPWFRTRAKSNQRVGGKAKGSSQLTEADRLDVRVEIARAAGVSVGNVSEGEATLAGRHPRTPGRASRRRDPNQCGARQCACT